MQLLHTCFSKDQSTQLLTWPELGTHHLLNRQGISVIPLKKQPIEQTTAMNDELDPEGKLNPEFYCKS